MAVYEMATSSGGWCPYDRYRRDGMDGWVVVDPWVVSVGWE